MFPGFGSVTIVAANGDSVSFDYVGVLDALTGEGTGSFTFTTGTGRFADVSGQGTFDALIDLSFPTGQPMTVTLEGNISYEPRDLAGYRLKEPFDVPPQLPKACSSRAGQRAQKLPGARAVRGSTPHANPGRTYCRPGNRPAPATRSVSAAARSPKRSNLGVRSKPRHYL
jgi:hypothetical protein